MDANYQPVAKLKKDVGGKSVDALVLMLAVLSRRLVLVVDTSCGIVNGRRRIGELAAVCDWITGLSHLPSDHPKPSPARWRAGKLPGYVVAMAACCGAHYMGRLLACQRHEGRLMLPEYVRPYAEAQKSDDRYAEAIAGAATRPTTRSVKLKSEDQLDTETLHRVRDPLLAERTSLMNQIRGVLLERGQIVPQGCARSAMSPAELLDRAVPALSARIAIIGV